MDTQPAAAQPPIAEDEPAAKKQKQDQEQKKGKRKSGQRKGPPELTEEQQQRKREWQDRSKGEGGAAKKSRRGGGKQEKERKKKEAAEAEKAKAAAAPPPTIPCTYCNELFSSRTQVFKHLRKGGTNCTNLAMADGLLVADKDKVQRTVLVVGVCADGSLEGGDVAAALRTAVAAGGVMPAGGEHDDGVCAAVPLGTHGEHAGCTVVSLNTPKLRCGDEAYVRELNAALPPSVRVVAAGSAQTEFNAANRCDKLIYEVMVPLPLLLTDVGDLNKGFTGTRFNRQQIANAWQDETHTDASGERRLVCTPGSDGTFELTAGCFIEWTQERAQYTKPHDARLAIKAADGSGWLVSKKDIFAVNAVGPNDGEVRQYDVNWMHPFAENYRWMRLDSDGLEIQGEPADAELLSDIAKGQSFKVSAVGLWFQRPVGWVGPRYTLGHYRVEIPTSAAAAAGTSRTRLEVNTALKESLNLFEGPHSFHNYSLDGDSTSAFATSASQTVWKAICAGNLLFVPKQLDDLLDGGGAEAGDGTGGSCGNSGGQEFVRLRFEGRHFRPGMAAAMASLAVLSVRLKETVTPELVAASLEPSCVLSSTGPLPPSLVYVAEAHYRKYESTTQTVIWPRDREIPHGFNTPQHELAVRTGRAVVQGCIANMESGTDAAAKRWAAEAEGLAARLNAQYALYQRTQQAHDGEGGAAVVSVPSAYGRVLEMLRAITSDQWPRTSNARRERIAAGPGGDAEVEEKKPAGESFSLGAMPIGPGLRQPQANAAFSDLLEACLDLEAEIMLERPPSSTVVINRNAQFKPHTDSGAGAGQSCSLIVGLGEYNGGGLVVEGKVHHIAYSPVEFDGWKQVHWTLVSHESIFPPLFFFSPNLSSDRSFC